jgi:two-component system cell cycle sensor histidine kinase/response regulator CckA
MKDYHLQQQWIRVGFYMDKNKYNYVENSVNELLIKLSPVLFFGAAVIFLCLSALDYVSVPHYFLTFLGYRGVVSSLLLILFLITYKYTFHSILIYKILVFIGVIISTVTVELMILKTGGHISSYYVGIGVVGIWAISFIPFRFTLSLMLMLTIYSIYVIPIVATETITDFQSFFTANAFIILLLSSALVLRYYYFNILVNELLLKFDLEEHKLHLENQVNDRTAELSESLARSQKEMLEREWFKLAVKKSSDEWMATVDATTDVIMMLSADYMVLRLNKAGTFFYNQPFKDLIGKSLFHLLPADTLRKDANTKSALNSSLEREEGSFYLSGKKAWLFYSLDPILDDDGRLTGWVFMMRDITERIQVELDIKKSSNEWRATFDSTTDVIMTLNTDYRLLRLNKAGTLFYNQSFKDLIGKSLLQLFPAVLKQKPEREEGAVYLSDKKVWVSYSVDPIRDDDGQLTGRVFMMRDITGQIKAEEEQRKLQAELLQIQKMDSIGRLAGGVAHDFNNILTAIIGFSQVALMKLPNDHPAVEPIRIIFDSGFRAASLTAQLLAFSRKQVLETKVINLNTVIENMVKMLCRVIGENIVLDLKLRKPIMNIVADAGQMEQVLMNLLVNARDAMTSGGQVTVETTEVCVSEELDQKVTPGSYVMMSVSDAGIGMSEEVQERIFEPFYTTKGIGKGTGLGLATVYGIVKQHDGHITVHSEQGRGTTFKLYFPLVDREVDVPNILKPSQLIGGIETVLVVDDEPSIRKLLLQTMQPLGYTLLDAASGEDAVKVSDTYTGTIDLLIADVVMSGISGMQLADILQQRRPGLEAIFISGYTDNAMAQQDRLDRKLILMQKPLIPSVLMAKVREVLDSKKALEKTTSTLQDLGGMRILFADDDESSRLLVGMLLEKSNCDLDICENGQRAISKFQSGSYDLVLMDMQMPVMDGFAASRLIRSWEATRGLKTTPIIAVTGLGGKEELQASLTAGCTSHIMKPISREVLFKAVSSYSSQRLGIAADKGDGYGTGKIIVKVDTKLQGIMPGYLQSKQEDITALSDAVEKTDFESIRILGHSMKGSGGGYGLDNITEIGKQIELAARDHDLTAIRESINELSQYLSSITIVYE